jgi:hypothetical protein
LELSAFAYSRPSGFTDPLAWDGDLAGGLGGASSPSRENARTRLDQAIRFYNEAGRLAADLGVAVNLPVGVGVPRRILP